MAKVRAGRYWDCAVLPLRPRHFIRHSFLSRKAEGIVAGDDAVRANNALEALQYSMDSQVTQHDYLDAPSSSFAANAHSITVRNTPFAPSSTTSP